MHTTAPQAESTTAFPEWGSSEEATPWHRAHTRGQCTHCSVRSLQASGPDRLSATTLLPRLHPPLGKWAQWPAVGWPKVAWYVSHVVHTATAEGSHTSCTEVLKPVTQRAAQCGTQPGAHTCTGPPSEHHPTHEGVVDSNQCTQAQASQAGLIPQHHTPPFLPRLQGLLTLFAKSFASFNHSTCALSVPRWYSSLWWIHPTLQTAVPSRSTRGYEQ